MSRLLERWTVELGKDGAEEALARHPEIAAMSWQDQEILLRSLEHLHESRNVPMTVGNSEELYRHYFADEAPKQQEIRIPKGAEAEREFLRTATADQLKAYYLAKG